MKDDEYNYEDIGYLWDKRTGNKKTIACFFFISFLFWTVGMDSDADTSATPGKDAPRTVNLATRSVLLRLCCYVFSFFVELIYRGWPRL